MRKIIILGLVLSVCNPAYSQSVFRVLQKGSRLKIRRTMTVLPKQARLAQRVALNQSTIQGVEMRVNRAIVTTRIEQKLVRPMEVVGPNRYLRIVSKAFKNKPGWKRLNSSVGYNGAHHIITKSVIKEICNRCHVDMLANAPSVFHPLHNSAEYSEVFHGHERQLELYYTRGVKGIVDNFFKEINEINLEHGLPLYNKKFIEAEMLEAELWTRYWNLRWE
ncbi:MAG: hypothetical protein J6Y25_04345 [Elusimicrobiaceae bacterium]|nr:hypothetical protein [Elusimicrobiaceae bacterium]